MTILRLAAAHIRRWWASLDLTDLFSGSGWR